MLPVLFLGLMTACKKDKGEKATVGDAKAVSSAMGATYNVDPGLTKVLWTGSKPTGSHNGSINVTSGTVKVDGDKVTGGNFTIDMNTISCLDLDDDGKGKLEGHLKAPDFFDVAKFPTAKFEITKVVALSGNTDANSMVYGNLTMKDISKEIGFKANIEAANGNVTVSTPQFNVNRTDWGIKYKSKSFTEGIKDKFINDEIGLQINLRAKA